MRPKIESFDGKNRFLSNFFVAPIMYEGVRYGSSEAAYQAAKCANIADRAQFIGLNPWEVKKLGRAVEIRPDWDEVKFDIMLDIVRIKFNTYPTLALMLKKTRGIYLEEGNTWGDIYWGVCRGVGENNLGKILMMIREELL